MINLIKHNFTTNELCIKIIYNLGRVASTGPGTQDGGPIIVDTVHQVISSKPVVFKGLGHSAALPTC